MRESAGSFATQLQGLQAFAQPVPHVTARLTDRREDDGSRLTIELDPVELGSVEVAVRLDDRGVATATFVVERPETLQLLQRDSRALVDALANAGFTLDQTNLGFQLRDGQEQQPRHQNGDDRSPSPDQPRQESRDAAPAAQRPSPGRGLLDLRV
jgi:flagellar hook-length control protein FliK